MNKEMALERIKQGFLQSQAMLLALGDENRQLIIVALLQVGCTGTRVGTLTAETHLSRPAISHHLKILKVAGLVTLRKVGTKHYYAVNPSANFAVLQSTTAVIQQLAQEEINE
ncbi:ArsR/SmtB family transcription factor [Loigolactobacillus backii]|uniref:Transcriptional regulator n=1 Tax=Loigolactobacillus backii TaxID=375175 RepID=A0A192H2A5_9LACO|nr:metalloregulator ArsR/SmtB family transcription factor [Loigolactobacillus backii]ANK60190.1 transcriptional regulator [Loigolactobacillus backii]ANK62367.1 transcriptional regulator [Loigolactobacillus backii]ANK65072.1 transcriptional regulator [Loigolactobacillus backii]ANK67628.1 transcriptional regulator [Loigolactobacillus backii]ANK70621.1 transcriptional regulator [Loigolactobacillus backii]